MATFGIDVSLWQKGFDFAKAKAEGVKFVIVKASQNNYIDPQFENHYKNAKAAGLDVGAYHYLVATTVEGAKKEAQTFINALKGKQYEYPVFVDVEEASQKKIGKTALTGIVEAFCKTLEAAGYVCGFYTNYDFYRNYMNGEALSKSYPLWIASWSKTAPVNCPMWQFGGETNVLRTNKVAGVTCDQNYCYVDYPAQIKANGKNGYKKPIVDLDIIYQSFFCRWGLEVSAKTTTYSGDSDHPISGIRAKSTVGKVYIQSRLINGKELGLASAYVKDGMQGTGYSGQLFNGIDVFRVKVEGIDPTKVRYRGHWDGKNGKWGRWITCKEFIYAGASGHLLDGVQIEVVK